MRTAAASGRVTVLVFVVGLDVSAVVAAALGADAVEDDAEVLGLELPQAVTHALEQATAVAAGADHADDTIDARREGGGLGDEKHRAAVEHDVVVLFER